LYFYQYIVKSTEIIDPERSRCSWREANGWIHRRDIRHWQ